MGIRSLFARPFAAYLEKQTLKWATKPVEAQQRVFNNLLENGKQTLIGADRKLAAVKSYQEFNEAIPPADYEGIKSYIELIKQGQQNVLWPGAPLYFAKTSGTTSGAKYIPITKASAPNHVGSATQAVFSYIHETGNAKFLDNKLIFLSGSPQLDELNGIKVGRLSGIVNHLVPNWLRKNQMPSYATNCIDDWETKLDAIVAETLPQSMGLISGIPPWVQMYFDKLQEKSGGKKIKEIFPNFSLFVYGGVNFEPYRKKLFDSIGNRIDSIETYPASEGFFAYQDNQQEEGMLLLLDSGIFYQFIPMDEYGKPNARLLSIGEVQKGVNYALVISTNAGLWNYVIGDTIKFVNTAPYRVVVTGRISHYTSAFGEHVIGEEVEKALKATLQYHPEVEIVEFTVAPELNPEQGSKPYHEWLIEFGKEPHNMPAFERRLDENMRKLNIYYNDLIKDAVLEPLHITKLHRSSFIEYMKTLGKLGGQNKVPRLSNDRKIAVALLSINGN